jgi:hypothetical protein
MRQLISDMEKKIKKQGTHSKEILKHKKEAKEKNRELKSMR